MSGFAYRVAKTEAEAMEDLEAFIRPLYWDKMFDNKAVAESICLDLLRGEEHCWAIDDRLKERLAEEERLAEGDGPSTLRPLTNLNRNKKPQIQLRATDLIVHFLLRAKNWDTLKEDDRERITKVFKTREKFVLRLSQLAFQMQHGLEGIFKAAKMFHENSQT